MICQALLPTAKLKWIKNVMRFKITIKAIKHSQVICCFGNCLKQTLIPQGIFHPRKIAFVPLIALASLDCSRTFH